MAISKPYYRIFRPGAGIDFLKDTRYCDEANELFRALQLLELDLKKVFEYVEPCNKNLETYSQRLYELLLRACTEFEASAKAILCANSYQKSPDAFTIKDYRLINKATKISEYNVSLLPWSPESKVLQPFKNWENTHTLDWYSAYNNVKHNRFSKFHDASLENVINAIAGVYIIIYSQINYLTITGVPQSNQPEIGIEDKDYYQPFFNNSIFSISAPSWNNNEKYNFNWNDLKKDSEPFDKYVFTNN